VLENREALKPARFAVPRPPPGHVVRQRSLRLLDEAAVAPLALLVAGAGWGKTALLRSWAEHSPSAWLTLEPELGSRQAFWEGFALALTQAGIPSASWTTAASDPETYQLELAELVRAHDQPLRLVLDEFEHVYDEVVAGELEQLIHSTGDRLSVVIASRVEPPFRLQRLRLSGLLAELRPTELAFTLEETAALFRQHGIELAEPELRLLWRRMEGWPAGLGLTALALRGASGAPTAAQALTAAEHDLRDYLLKEVVERQSPERLELLLHTSILSAVDGELADALTDTGNGAQLLGELAREGFLTEVECTGAYRPNPVLLELLRSETARRLPGEVPELHRRAALVLAGRGTYLTALRHAVAGENWEQAAGLLGDHWLSLAMQRGSHELIELVRRVPTRVLQGDAELALAASGLALETGDDQRADELLRLARQLAPRLPESRRARAAVTSVVVDLYRARSAGNVEQSLQAARYALGKRWQHRVGEDLRGLTFASLGASEFWLGEYDAAGAHLEQAADLAEARGNDYLLFVAQSYSVGVDLCCGRLDDVRRRTVTVEELARARGWTEVPHGAIAYLSLGAAHMWAHELDEAERRTEQARRAATNPRDRLSHVAVTQLRATLLALRGDASTALELLRRAHAAATPLPRPLELSGIILEADLRLALGEPESARTMLEALGDVPEAAIGLARVELASGDPSAAATTIAHFRSDERSALRPYANVEAWLIDALAHDVLHDDQRSLHSLERALDAAEPRGLRHPFFRLGPRVHALVRRHARSETRHRALVAELLTALDAGERGRPTGSRPLLEPLSERELTVLRFLPTMMSNAEIAAELFVSVNTIKTHLRHVYAKLGATNRREAVRRARELRLLSPGLHAY
jgi:LuxR family maltose regulon positive regulatory protein